MKTEYATSTNEESYNDRTEFDSPEECAITFFNENTADTIVWVGEVVDAPDPADFIDADVLLEHIQNTDEFSQEWSEDWPGANVTQLDDLTTAIKKTFSEWIDRHNLEPQFFTIKNPKKFRRDQFPELPPATQEDEE